MVVFRTLLLWALAVSWLPATLHCAVENAGLLTQAEGCCTQEQAEPGELDGHCISDSCDLLESTLIKHATDAVKLPAPGLLMALFFPSVAPVEAVPLPTASPARTAVAEALPRPWQFVVRAAMPPRAPGVVS